MRKVELLPTRDCEAGYGPGYHKRHQTLHTEMSQKLPKVSLQKDR